MEMAYTGDMTYRSAAPITCIVCKKANAIGRKLCRNCYNRARNQGHLADYPVVGPQDVFEGRIEKTDNCWLWRGTRNGYGYGIFLMPGERPVRAHRYSYEFFVGPIPDGLVVMHTCDNPPCVNPAHLRLGTKGDNNADAARKKRTKSGLLHWNGRLSEEDVLAIRKSGEPQAALAKRYGVTQSHISRIKSGHHRKSA